MTSRIQLLDHGYIEIVDVWGSDQKIVEAARMSTAKGFLGWDPGPCEACGGTGKVIGQSLEADPLIEALLGDPIGFNAQDPELTWDTGPVPCHTCSGKGVLAGDAKLLSFLYKHKHFTPFEMGGMIIESAAPILAYREWFRHRTQGYNEMSGRYVALPNVNYVPSIERLLMASATNKQAGRIAGAGELTTEGASAYRIALRDMYDRQERLYQAALALGVPKELARAHIGVGRYSRMRATGVLRNILGFITLRSDKAAMFEIRQYSDAWATFCRERFPRTMELFDEAAGR